MTTIALETKRATTTIQTRAGCAVGMSFVVHGGLVAILGLLHVGDRPLPQSITLHATVAREFQSVESLLVTPVELELQQQAEAVNPNINLTETLDSLGGAEGSTVHHNSRVASQLSQMPGLFSHGAGQGSGQAERGAGFAGGGVGKYQSPFESLVRELRLGLDLVIVFDSTSSMGAEIAALKLRIFQLGRIMLQTLPETRLAFVSYKDVGDSPTVAFSQLTNDLASLHRFLSLVEPMGGGFDVEEAVGLGLKQAVLGYQFRTDAHKVVIILGDAPPRRADIRQSMLLAREFHALQKARVSTLTVRAAFPIQEFASIARAGGGESVVLVNQRHALRELLLLVFGVDNRAEALQLLRVRDH